MVAPFMLGLTTTSVFITAMLPTVYTAMVIGFTAITVLVHAFTAAGEVVGGDMVLAEAGEVMVSAEVGEAMALAEAGKVMVLVEVGEVMVLVEADVDMVGADGNHTSALILPATSTI